MEGRVLCLVERTPGYFQFEVQSLREYFAAAYVNQYADPRGVGNSRVDCFDALLARPYWLNTCRFFVGMFTKIEVRGIERSLRELEAEPELKLHPHLRLTAGRVLDDRAYQGQPSDTIRKVVDFILDGSGVVLAEDGFLEETGRPLTFAEDAGRNQAVVHLKARLASPAANGTRQAAARMLRRHGDRADLTKWWWSKFQPSGDWLETAADLGAIAAFGAEQEGKLANAVSNADGDTRWGVELLARGGYAGNADDVLAVCKEQIGDGAVDVLSLDASTPLGKLVWAARAVLLRHPRESGNAGPSSARTRIRSAAGRKLVADVLTAMEPLRALPAHNADTKVWVDRLAQVVQVWGDSWLTRQAVGLLPSSVDLAAAERTVANSAPRLASALSREMRAREHRSDADWWRSQGECANGVLDRRVWLLSVLTIVRLPVIVQLSTEIDVASAALVPKHYRAMEQAIASFMKSPLARQLVLHDPLRRGLVSFSGRSLGLLSLVATDSSSEQLARKSATAYVELLEPGMGDRRQMLRALGQRKTVRISDLRGTRETLPDGAWAGEVKLGAITAATAKDVLQHPEVWPSEIVEKAIQVEANRLSGLPPIARTAKENGWFRSSE